MEIRTSVVSPPFRLELETEQLWREDQTIALRPKSFAVLRYLVHAGQLVTKGERYYEAELYRLKGELTL